MMCATTGITTDHTGCTAVPFRSDTDKSSFAAKKMIVSQFIKAVRVGRDYNIEVDFNVSFDEFESYCGVKSKGSVEADTALVRTA